jgi:hypothetical protein
MRKAVYTLLNERELVGIMSAINLSGYGSHSAASLGVTEAVRIARLLLDVADKRFTTEHTETLIAGS